MLFDIERWILDWTLFELGFCNLIPKFCQKSEGVNRLLEVDAIRLGKTCNEFVSCNTFHSAFNIVTHAVLKMNALFMNAPYAL